MELVLVNNSLEWDTGLQALGERPPFLQSWAWGEILRSEGKLVERLLVRQGSCVVAEAQVVCHQLPGGWKYAVCPGGPALNCEPSAAAPVYELLAGHLKTQRHIFWRLEPSVVINNPLLATRRVADLNPQTTVVLDLTPPGVELQASLPKKIRYSLRQAAAAGLAVKEEKNTAVFFELLAATARRDRFRPHPNRHYQAVLDSPVSYQLTAYQGSRPLSSAIFIWFANTITYLFAAADYRARALGGPYLVVWEGMRLGQRLGGRYLDLFGIAPAEGPGSSAPGNKASYTYDQRHQYAGLTQFKLHWGGRVVSSPGTYDLIISPGKYKIYQLLRKLRRLVPSP